jgi:hypothetical protein
MTSIGTLFAFVVVCAAVIVLRVRRPDAPRSFRVPGGFVLPVLGVLSCLYLMLSLSVVTWVRFLAWLDVGLVIYWFYGRTHSTLAIPEEQAKETLRHKVGNFLVTFGALFVFNGFSLALLGLLTRLGITTEATARWHEVHLTPEQADLFGLAVLVAGAIVLVTGWVLSKTNRGGR